MDWFKGKSTGNHPFYHQISGFPVNVPIIQFYEIHEWYIINMVILVTYHESPQDGKIFFVISGFEWKNDLPQRRPENYPLVIKPGGKSPIGGVPTSSCIYRRCSIATLNYLEDMSFKLVKDNRIQHPQIDNPYWWFITAVLTLHAMQMSLGMW